VTIGITVTDRKLVTHNHSMWSYTNLHTLKHQILVETHLITPQQIIEPTEHEVSL
jgi:hypothetical protein